MKLANKLKSDYGIRYKDLYSYTNYEIIYFIKQEKIREKNEENLKKLEDFLEENNVGKSKNILLSKVLEKEWNNHYKDVNYITLQNKIIIWNEFVVEKKKEMGLAGKEYEKIKAKGNKLFPNIDYDMLHSILEIKEFDVV